ncbi:PP2C family protein-serine/threonine phosphatase [Enterobacter hormaechei]|uniref:PP2C family protein-serine/threonine phosphatase n=1 Tax=Enterobacter hormaechei TaxID=158836 RepID=UPI00069BA5B8|nr:protein phosphatase 2C domain-containing protein [Enterobacter hormaechei]KUR21145.1 hypothetical protein AWI36_15745 [Enterobacter hormaechei subsp. steigerwaltii]
MHPFQDSLQVWFSRKLPEHAFNQCWEIPFVLSSDIGLVRKENQDRVAALHTGKKSVNPLFAIAVVDGMGGMRDGGGCASLALSGFFYALIQYRSLEIKDRINAAIKLANKQVFDIYNGSGGATLTAVLFDSQGNRLFVHVGDTRIYTFSSNAQVQRHTTDDSLAEAVGGSGRELLQFVGMGESMQPKIAELTDAGEFCAITTDGIHGIEEKTLNKLFVNSSDIKQIAERLCNVSKWCGGHDNATSAILNLKNIAESLSHYEVNGIRIWDAQGDLTTLWLREGDVGINFLQGQNVNNSVDTDEGILSSKQVSEKLTNQQKKINKDRASKKRTVNKKKADSQPEKIQLDIEIGKSGEKGEFDVDTE